MTFYLHSQTKPSRLHPKSSGSKRLYKLLDSRGGTNLKQKINHQPVLCTKQTCWEQDLLWATGGLTVCESVSGHTAAMKHTSPTPASVLRPSVTTTAALSRSVQKPNLISKESSEFYHFQSKTRSKRIAFHTKLTFVRATSVLSDNTFLTSLIKHMWDSVVFKD